MSTIRVGHAPDQADGSDDERRLYGDPQHEVTVDDNPERLYGTPQHEGEPPTSDVERFWLDCFAFRKSVQCEDGSQ
ncbi:hypothetical protein [Haladaptatus sp. T7]|uniref:hypothetical protein n=1 Tax=Haladaptatus sp. T7 TaxID=2029368 RepID=UPI0021A25423|nr:hypothetical protein [Haladaptatus sp. T7]GKZ13339.1 hypothetical protein HAL_12200 [Haladaptatus sp. T7]